MSPRTTLKPASKGAYEASWQAFVAWVRGRGDRPLPALASSISAYLTDLAARGKRLSTIERALAAVVYTHRQLQNDWKLPESVRQTLVAIRARAKPKTSRDPIDALALRAMVQSCRMDVAGTRDRAVLTLGYATALRRSQLVALDVGDARISDGKLLIGNLIILSSADPATCAVRNVHRWLEAARITEGPLFRAVSRSDRVLERRLSDRAVADIVKVAAKAAGLDATRISPHSLRIEYVQETT